MNSANTYETEETERGVVIYCNTDDGRIGSAVLHPVDDPDWCKDPYPVAAILEACEAAEEDALTCDHCEGAGELPVIGTGGTESYPCPDCRDREYSVYCMDHEDDDSPADRAADYALEQYKNRDL